MSICEQAADHVPSGDDDEESKRCHSRSRSNGAKFKQKRKLSVSERSALFTRTNPFSGGQDSFSHLHRWPTQLSQVFHDHPRKYHNIDRHVQSVLHPSDKTTTNKKPDVKDHSSHFPEQQADNKKPPDFSIIPQPHI